MVRALVATCVVTAVFLAGCHGPPVDGSKSGGSTGPLDIEGIEDFTMFQGDMQRTGKVDGDVPDAVALDWRLRGLNKWTHTAAKGSPVIVDGTILIGADTGILYRVSATGEVMWGAATYPSRNGVHGTPAVHDDIVYLGAYDGALYAYELDTGHLLWRTPIGGSIGSSPVYYDGHVYVSVETPIPSGIMAVVHARTGELLWTDHDIGDHPHSSVALDPERNVMVVGANDGVLYAWDLDTRERRWTIHEGGERDSWAVKGPPALADGYAYFGSWDGHLHKVDLDDGKIVWTFEANDKIMPGPAVDVDAGLVFIGSHDDHVYAVDIETGDEVWSRDVNGWVIGSLIVIGDTVLAGSYDKRLYAIERDTGHVTWTYQTAGRVTSTPAIMGDRIVFAERATTSTVGSLWAIGPPL